MKIIKHEKLRKRKKQPKRTTTPASTPRRVLMSELDELQPDVIMQCLGAHLCTKYDFLNIHWSQNVIHTYTHLASSECMLVRLDNRMIFRVGESIFTHTQLSSLTLGDWPHGTIVLELADPGLLDQICRLLDKEYGHLI